MLSVHIFSKKKTKKKNKKKKKKKKTVDLLPLGSFISSGTELSPSLSLSFPSQTISGRKEKGGGQRR